jgi:hypothetical protein
MSDTTQPKAAPSERTAEPGEGFYAPSFSTAECGDLARAPAVDLQSEIDLLRVFARRASAMIDDPNLAPREQIRAVRAVSEICARISTLINANDNIRTRKQEDPRTWLINQLGIATDRYLKEIDSPLYYDNHPDEPRPPAAEYGAYRPPLYPECLVDPSAWPGYAKPEPSGE